MSTFEDFLTDCLDHGHTQIRLVPRLREDGGMAFYAHGQGGPSSGETFDGVAAGDTIINMVQPEMPPAPELAPFVDPATEEEMAALAGTEDPFPMVDAENDAAVAE